MYVFICVFRCVIDSWKGEAWTIDVFQKHMVDAEQKISARAKSKCTVSLNKSYLI
jgi:hypothetical protein